MIFGWCETAPHIPREWWKPEEKALMAQKNNKISRYCGVRFRPPLCTLLILNKPHCLDIWVSTRIIMVSDTIFIIAAFKHEPPSLAGRYLRLGADFIVTSFDDNASCISQR